MARQGTAICVAHSWAAAAYLRELTEGWLKQPPRFEWRLILSDHARQVFGNSPAASRFGNSESDLVSDVRNACDEPGPKAVFVSAGGAKVELDVVASTRSTGVPVLQYIDTWYGYRRRMQKGAGLVLGDRILVIDQCAINEAVAEGLPPDILVAVGHPVWERCHSLPPIQIRRLLFIGAPVQRDYGTKLGYTEVDAWQMLKETLDASPHLADDIIYAPHPDDASPLVIDGIEVVKYQSELLSSVDTVIGMFSAPLIEAFLVGRRVITLQPHASGYDMCPLSRHNRIPRVTTCGALTAALTAMPPDPGQLSVSLTGSCARVTSEIERALAA